MRESEFTRRVCKMAEAQGALVFALVAGRRQINGLPDRLVVHHGVTYWVEFKGPKTQLRTIQRVTLKRLRSRSAPACVCQMIDDSSMRLWIPGESIFVDCEWENFLLGLQSLLGI